MSTIDYDAFLAKLKGDQPASPAVSPEQNGVAGLPDAPRATGPNDARDKPPLASKLETVAGRAIDKSGEILNFPLDPESNHFPAVLRAQTAVINTALITQTRVDEGYLRHRQTDTLAKLLEIMKREEAKLPKRLSEQGSGGDDGPP